GKGPPTGIVVEDAQPEAQHVWGVGPSAVDGRTTTTAECAEDSGRGFELPDEVLALDAFPILPPDVGVRSKGRPAGLSASRAVTVDDRPELTGHLDPNPAAQTLSVH